ncbi:Uncharacterised protein [Yersinia frederiksenii]|uniref:Integral membrane protein n=2 Tax=Yersinia alsatica TaxID=2890317 RepID=A0ABY5UJF8_9GAMM|nr:hypothetical protein [Yersinia alsatica]CFQ62610.1 Uncharacterised protein [Yersinia frederiksenii]UWM43621.1 hypothetical protein N0H69_12885 [Yersinia alsatica]CNC14093.1 Uncharacterised protein [Yersinia frederiksenii]CNI13161.1 Uncharacterised protein [Yersinia frederiksenii]CNI45186.1 Uncharacterised protein [Yersinia frederiksenii]
MGTVLALMGLILGAWAVRSICLKEQSTGKKVAKSIFAAWYFLTAGGIGGTEEDKIVLVIVAMLIGAAVVLYSNHADKVSSERS